VCFWSWSFASGPCGTADWWQFELVEIAGDLTAQVSLYRGTTLAAVWQVSVESYIPLNCCDELDGLVLTNVTDDDTYCDWSGSTITLEAICGETNPSYCQGCLSNTYPDELEVTLTGFVDGACDCSIANRTFVLPINSKSAACTWLIAGALSGGWCVTYISVSVQISYNTLTNTTTISGVVSFGRFDEGIGTTRYWSCGTFSKAYTGKIDCMLLDDYLTLDSSTCTSNRVECDASGVTFHVRAA
jgi:hypothetical protein